MWSIYSPEDFPKQSDDGLVDYRQAFGIQVVLKAHQWTELKGQDGDGIGWRIEYFNNFVDARGDGKEIFTTCKEWAIRVTGDFRTRGLRMAELDKITPEQRKAIEQDAESANMAFRKGVIERFEIGFRERMLGNPGRLSPNAYEIECYALHGKKPPSIVPDSVPAVQPTPQFIVAQPDPAMIAELVAKEVERLTAPKGA